MEAHKPVTSGCHMFTYMQALITQYTNDLRIRTEQHTHVSNTFFTQSVECGLMLLDYVYKKHCVTSYSVSQEIVCICGFGGLPRKLRIKASLRSTGQLEY